MTATKIIGDTATTLFNLARFSQENMLGDYISEVQRKREAHFESSTLLSFAFKNANSGEDILANTVTIARKTFSRVREEEISVENLSDESALTFKQMTKTHSYMLMDVLTGLTHILYEIREYEDEGTVFEYRTQKKIEELYVCIDIISHAILNAKIDVIEKIYAEFVNEFQAFVSMLNENVAVIPYPLENIVN